MGASPRRNPNPRIFCKPNTTVIGQNRVEEKQIRQLSPSLKQQLKKSAWNKKMLYIKEKRY
jgi:hypothetical protein